MQLNAVIITYTSKREINGNTHTYFQYIDTKAGKSIFGNLGLGDNSNVRSEFQPDPTIKLITITDVPKTAFKKAVKTIPRVIGNIKDFINKALCKTSTQV